MKRTKRLASVVGLMLVIAISSAYKSDFFEIAKQIEIYTSLFKELNLYYINETNPAELTDTAIANMLKDLDPYTQYFDEQGVEKARINAAGEFGGIGADAAIIDKKLIITEPYEKGPADKAGLKAGDEILKINDISVDENTLEDAPSLLNGTPGSEVTVQISRNGKTLIKTLSREKVEIDPVPYYHMIDDEVGYIAFIRFNSKASAQVRNAFEDLQAQGMKRLILDVRGNPGGLLNEAVEITNFFIPKDETVVTTQAKIKKWSDVYKTKREPLNLEIPVVVLINRLSASASEILAGSLQDLDRAVIVGERSFGKGLVQRYRSLPYGTQLKLTISKYYTPSGRCIQELDYSHRQENGKIARYSDEKINAYKTKNGRTVYDGGGIEPDVKLQQVPRTEATKALVGSEAIFKYAIDFYYRNNEIKDPKQYTFSDSDFQDFLNAIHENRISFSTSTENELQKTLKAAESDGFSENINAEYKQLTDKLKQEKIKDLMINKNEIKTLLADEIVKRYYFKKGEYIYKVHNDKAVLEALAIVKDAAKYRGILK